MPTTSQPAGEKKLWGGRFTGDTDPLMVQFNESLPIDKRMWKEDLQVEFLPGRLLLGTVVFRVSAMRSNSQHVFPEKPASKAEHGW